LKSLYFHMNFNWENCMEKTETRSLSFTLYQY
jgi:hypothetical protein